MVMNDYTEPVGESWKYDPDYHRASDYLGIDRYERDDFQVAQKLSTVRDWARENSKADTLEDSLATIHGLARKLGTQSRGKALLNELYQHLRFQTGKPLQKSNKARPKTKSAPRAVKKADPISKIVQKSVEGRIAEIVAKTMSNKNVVYKAVNNIIRNTLK